MATELVLPQFLTVLTAVLTAALTAVLTAALTEIGRQRSSY
jgi:hypothetical protein